jgi:predicted nucleic acid-binding protein
VNTFFDASTFAKRYVEENGSQLVDDVSQEASELTLSVMCLPEIISALNRLIREKRLSHQHYVAVKQHLSDDVRDAVIINVTPEVIATSTSILEASPQRAMDALHIACVLQSGADLFVSSDKRQITAARKAGLRAKYI